MTYNFKHIRHLFEAGFSEAELRRFCRDTSDFAPLYKELPKSAAKADLVALIIDYADQKVKIPILLTWAETHNPDRYHQHQPYQTEASPKMVTVVETKAIFNPPIGLHPPDTPIKTIDRHQALTHFHHLMQAKGPHRVLRLLGEAKMGKSHLLTKVFPALARQQYGVEYAIVLDLRNEVQGIPDLLRFACNRLQGEAYFPRYQHAYQAWLNQGQKNTGGLSAFLSRFSAAGQEGRAENWQTLNHMTHEFVADLRQLNAKPILLQFDAVNEAAPDIQKWLMHTFLVDLCHLPHLRIVVAGQTLPEASSSYLAQCQSYSLPPVQEDSAYIHYCQEIGVSLDESAICAFARAFDYRPIKFVTIIPKFMSGGPSYDR